MNILKLSLIADDLSLLKNFYYHILGFEIAKENIEILSFIAGNSILSFEKSEKVKGIYHFAFNIPGNKLQESLEWLKQKVEVWKINAAGEYIIDFPNWHAKSVYFFDPVGNIVEFIARFDLNYNSGEPFSANSISEISEAGIVTKDVPALTDFLKNKYGLKEFSRQKNSSHFSVVGDDHGLFIIVPEKRKWFLTDIEAKILPLSVTIKNDEGEIYDLNF